eukprot:975321-Prymnesium_polylepis.1
MGGGLGSHVRHGRSRGKGEAEDPVSFGSLTVRSLRVQLSTIAARSSTLRSSVSCVKRGGSTCQHERVRAVVMRGRRLGNKERTGPGCYALGQSVQTCLAARTSSASDVCQKGAAPIGRNASKSEG